MIRIEAIGPKIRIWFNRTHGDPEKGLRIEYTDKDDPILSGAVGGGRVQDDRNIRRPGGDTDQQEELTCHFRRLKWYYLGILACERCFRES